ncbi:HD domain-containing protein [Luteipulveratus mongoliensis]|uniref:Metal-dependent phosphohydrolase n=1 Tax=Luteipulveratus mongoliensis TaxID=571913 RepID=A0A0K1JGN9_9MICO|nr:HD domain-containing protein [Luteipulveratus mongoliensis]AKU15879.1 metal-dependent phosphohydrolase [Luteipulveratus mongoliensis]
MSDVVDRLRELFEGEGGRDYLGEDVSMAQHMLQAAQNARAADAADHLVVAALVHDVGHFTGVVSGRELMAGKENHHDDAGADWLAEWFGPEVTEPVRLHVAAKRYLCAVEPAYIDALSEASVYTLDLQGGPMSAAEVAEFEANSHHADAVTLRRWEDAGKDANASTVDFEEFVPTIRAVATTA